MSNKTMRALKRYVHFLFASPLGDFDFDSIEMTKEIALAMGEDIMTMITVMNKMIDEAIGVQLKKAN